MISFETILAVDNQFGIGKNNSIPWNIREDMTHFRSITSGHILLMGRKTWDSLPQQLPNRVHIVFGHHKLDCKNNPKITRPDSFYFFESIDAFIYTYNHAVECPDEWKNKKLFIIGGAQIFQSFFTHPQCIIQKIHLTYIPHNFNCDVHISKKVLSTIHNHHRYILSCANTCLLENPITIESNSKIIRTIYFYEYTLTNIPHPESEYCKLVSDILMNGSNRGDRTLIGTRSIFGCQMRFPIKDSFPLLTSKRMFWKGIVEELLWFLRGGTNIRPLQQHGVHIWDGNTSPEYLESRGLSHYVNGECGPIYGFQFRHFGAEYTDCHGNYEGRGYDQVAEVLRLIREEPTSRRIMISLWNPPDLNKQILPPCHVLYQFYVNEEERTLSCSMYQRSGDVGLGIPFNIASASLMTYIFAHLTGLQPGEFIHSIGDAHIYQNHIGAMEEQLTRAKYPWSKLQIHQNSGITNRPHERVEDFCYDDFELLGYFSEDSIKMKMAV
jgi:dihydrofolate reductase/thymidylate synthase